MSPESKQQRAKWRVALFGVIAGMLITIQDVPNHVDYNVVLLFGVIAGMLITIQYVPNHVGYNVVLLVQPRLPVNVLPN